MTAGTCIDSSEAPDFAEAIEAWRVWRVVASEDGYSLGSVLRPTLWQPGQPLVAECLRTSTLLARLRRRRRCARTVPDEQCECGIYAASLSFVDQYLRYAHAPATHCVARVLGQVSLWGTVIEYERGYRASHAYPLRVYVPVDASLRGGRRWEDLVAGLDGYGVPVEVLPARCSEAVAVLEQQALRSRI